MDIYLVTEIKHTSYCLLHVSANLSEANTFPFSFQTYANTFAPFLQQDLQLFPSNHDQL